MNTINKITVSGNTYGIVDTDTKVTSAANHYTPSANNNAELTASLSGTAGAYAKDTEYTVLTGVKAQRDAKGHVTGLTYTAQKIKDTDTNTWRPISDSVSSTSSNTSASSKAVKTAYDLAASKTSNTGTVTSVTVKMNNSEKGTVTTSGTIDLGTVLTDSIMPDPAAGHDYVDLGLPSGTKWATMNVGATSETGYGNYYMYGMGSKTYDSTDTPYAGTEDPLDHSVDTAAQVWGGSWHMPTRAQIQELIDNTTYLWVTNYKGSGINGGTFTGTNGAVLFFPAAGYYLSTGLAYAGESCYYLGSSPDNSSFSYYLYCDSYNKHKSATFGERLYGHTVRGVLDRTPLLHKVAVTGNYNDLENKPTALPASDVYSWAKASTKPKYIAGEVMNISLRFINSDTSSSCSITGTNNEGKAQTIIYFNNSNSDLTVTVPTTYYTPDDEAIELTCPAGGYCEVSFLNIGNNIFARGL